MTNPVRCSVGNEIFDLSLSTDEVEMPGNKWACGPCVDKLLFPLILVEQKDSSRANGKRNQGVYAVNLRGRAAA